VRRHAQPTAAPPEHPSKHVRISAAVAVVLAFLMGAMAPAAHADWTLGADAAVRHDNNVGNAQDRADAVADTLIDARLSAFQSTPIGEGFSVSAGGGLSGESFHRLTGLNNASLDGAVGVKKKWGLGAWAPWARAGVSIARSSYDDHYRDAWVYRTTLAAGRRIDERWNIWIEYAYERRAATTRTEQEAPGLSSDVYSQDGHSAALNTEYSLNERAFLAIGLAGRHGDVVSTTAANAGIFAAARALAEDPSFGPDAYAYKLTGTTFGFHVAVNYAPTPHSLIGCGFRRWDTHADGGSGYTKSLPEITWNLRF